MENKGLSSLQGLVEESEVEREQASVQRGLEGSRKESSAQLGLSWPNNEGQKSSVPLSAAPAQQWEVYPVKMGSQDWWRGSQEKPAE